MNNNKEKDLLNIQVIGSFIFIITILISIILTINNIKIINHQKPIFNLKNEKYITLINRFTILIIAISFTYINYISYQKNENKEDKNVLKKELIASVFNLISTVILLNTTIGSIKKNSIDPYNTII